MNSASDNPVLRIQCTGSPELPDLVLVHGWGSCSSVWQPLLGELEKIFCLHLVDLPDYPCSREEADRLWSTASIYAAFQEQLPEQAVWCGWSLGGMLATAYAAAHPVRVRALVTLCSNPVFVGCRAWSCGMHLDTFDAFVQGLNADPGKTIDRFAALVTRGSDDERVDLKHYRTLTSNCALPQKEQLIASLELLKQINNVDALTRIRLPVLKLFAQRDALVPVAVAEKTAMLNEHLQVRLIEGASHIPWLSRPAQVLDYMIAFCRAHGALESNSGV